MRQGSLLGRVLYGIAIAIGLVICGFPLYWMVRGALISQGLWLKLPVVWVPKFSDLTIDAFRKLFGPESSIVKVMGNTAALAVIATVCNVLFDSMAGFALAKMRVPGKRLILGLLLFSLMIPFETMMISLYLVVAKMGLADTMSGVALPLAANAFGIIIMYRFFGQVPDELIEAARIDGADWGTILFRVAMPLATPSIATLAVLNFLAGWEAFVWPLLITDPSSRFDVLQKVIANATYATVGGSTETLWPVLMATALCSTLPVLVIFFIGQRYFVKGLSAGAVKG